MQELTLKKIKSITPSQRLYKSLIKPKFFGKKFIKTKTIGLASKAGRNHSGRITVFHKGGGHKKLYRIVDFARRNSQGIVQGLEYDPFRKAFLARVYNLVNKVFYYILAPKNLFPGSLIYSGKLAEIKVGHALTLSQIPVGMLIHNIAIYKKKGGQYVRSAGTFAQLIQKTKKYARVILSSGEQRLIPLNAMATLGVVSNENYKLTTLGKAGRSRWLGRRPTVRGVAMNPVDHPHGGGEGKTSGGRPSVTPWGKPARGRKTSQSRNPLIVVRRIKK